MQTVLKLLIVIGELIQRYCDIRKQAQRDEQVDAIRKDPAGEFINEFGRVPNKPTVPSMPSRETRIEIDEH